MACQTLTSGDRVTLFPGEAVMSVLYMPVLGPTARNSIGRSRVWAPRDPSLAYATTDGTWSTNATEGKTAVRFRYLVSKEHAPIATSVDVMTTTPPGACMLFGLQMSPSKRMMGPVRVLSGSPAWGPIKDVTGAAYKSSPAKGLAGDADGNVIEPPTTLLTQFVITSWHTITDSIEGIRHSIIQVSARFVRTIPSFQ